MNWSTEKKIVAGAALTLLVLAANAYFSYRATGELIEHSALVNKSNQVVNQLEIVMSTMKDAETGNRGYLITGEEAYLEPYNSAVASVEPQLQRLEQLTADDPPERLRIPALREKVEARLALLKRTVELRRSNSLEEVRGQIVSGVGKRLMDDLRQYIGVMQADENFRLAERAEEAKDAGRQAYATQLAVNVIAAGLVFMVFFVIARDSSYRRASADEVRRNREWLRVTLSSIGDAVIATDEKGVVTFLNPVAESLTGWEMGAATGKNLTEIFNIVNESTRQVVDNPALRAISDGQIVGLANHTVLLARDGREVPIDDSGAPIKDDSGKIIGAVLVFHDISQRRKLERERVALLESESDARREAEAASRAKDEFVAMISHEIRAPLNSILGWSQMLRSQPMNDATREKAYETIERNARLQSNLIDDLLDLTRVITGKLTLDVQTVQPEKVIRAAMQAIAPAADAKSIELVENLQAGSRISADPTRVQQIIWNLLTNAVKFTPAGGRVEVGLEQVDSHVKISVSDTGIGIDPDFLPSVFDRFSQANTSSKRRYGGLGLGLAIVRHLAEVHGGTVAAQSDGEGLGAVFTVSLPLRAEHNGSDKSLSSLPLPGVNPPSDAGDVSLGGMKIMVVDDHADVRELLTVMLSARGATVETFDSGSAALSGAAACRPDLIVSDIGMPDLDGYEFIKAFRESGPDGFRNVPAVALTAFARSDDRVRAAESGFDAHVSKPVEGSELVSVIARLAKRDGTS